MKNMSAYSELTKNEAIAAILKDADLSDKIKDEKILKAMDWVFREGWYRGEEYMSDCIKADKTTSIKETKKCTVCGQECYDDEFPEVVFIDEESCICEECSIDYEEINGKIRLRKDILK